MNSDRVAGISKIITQPVNTLCAAKVCFDDLLFYDYIYLALTQIQLIISKKRILDEFPKFFVIGSFVQNLIIT